MMRYLWIFDIGIRDSNEFRPGWALHVLPIACMGVSLGFCAMAGVSPLSAFVVAASLFLCCSRGLIAQNVRRIRRMGWFSPIRGRWWIEIAALDWTLCMTGACFWLGNAMRGGGPLGGNAVLASAADLTGWAYLAFFPLTITAYVTGLVRGRRITGSSLETVNFFFWIRTVGYLSNLLPPLAAWFTPALAGIAFVLVIFAGILNLRASQSQRGSTPSDLS